MSSGPAPSSADLLVGFARAIPAIVLAVLFGWMAWFVRGNGGREIDWFGPAVLAVLAGCSAIWMIVRAGSKPRPKPGKAAEPEEPAFDADAALQRYLANRDERPVPVAEAEPAGPAPRPVFGRKTSS